LARPALLYGWETQEIREHYKYRITLAEMKFMRITAKYTWQDYETNEDVLSKLQINPIVN